MIFLKINRKRKTKRGGGGGRRRSRASTADFNEAECSQSVLEIGASGKESRLPEQKFTQTKNTWLIWVIARFTHSLGAKVGVRRIVAVVRAGVLKEMLHTHPSSFESRYKTHFGNKTERPEWTPMCQSDSTSRRMRKLSGSTELLTKRWNFSYLLCSCVEGIWCEVSATFEQRYHG